MGEQIRDYRILGEIGTGGMGTVYKAMHPGLNTPVILKKLKGRGVDLAERFKREARIMMGLRHDNIVPVFDYFIENGEKYIVMEFVDGVSLADLIEKRGRVDPRAALLIYAQVAHGLEYAHGKNVVHRDLKPHNILISKNGDVKIIDFGIAAIHETAPGDETVPALTMMGDAMGTPAYMPPEQMGDMGSVNARSDIFSLGVVLYEMLTGTRPFGNKFDTEAVAGRTGEKYRSPEALDASIPGVFRRIVKKSLRADPAARYKSVAIPGKILSRYYRRLRAADIRGIIAGYVFANEIPDAAKKIRPMYTSFAASFRESIFRKRMLVAGGAALAAGMIISFAVHFEIYYHVFNRSNFGAIEVQFRLPVSEPLRRLAWYRSSRSLPDRSRYPGLYADRLEEVRKALHAYISEEYSDSLFNFRMSAWLIKLKSQRGRETGREKLVLMPANYVRSIKGDEFEVIIDEDGSLPEHIVLSSGRIYREKGHYSAMMLFNGASYRNHFYLQPILARSIPSIVSMNFRTTPRNKINFSFSFLDHQTEKPIDGVEVKILWGGKYFDWEQFSKTKERMDYLWNGRTFTFKVSHPDYKTPSAFDIRVDRDQTIAYVVMNLEPRTKKVR